MSESVEDGADNGIFSGRALFDDIESREDVRKVNVSRADEMEDEVMPGGALVPVDTQQLIAIFDANGSVRVALTEEGNRIEEWRQPTKQEWALLKNEGQIVRGGMGDVPATTAPASGMTATKWAVVAGAVAVAAGAGIYFWQKYKDDVLEEEAEEE